MAEKAFQASAYDMSGPTNKNQVQNTGRKIAKIYNCLIIIIYNMQYNNI